eukprot:8662597-Pyramimonas_sp.AAC.1
MAFLLQDCPRWLQNGLDGPRWPRSSPKMVQDGLQDGPRGSKIFPSPPKKPPRWPKTSDGPRGA